MKPTYHFRLANEEDTPLIWEIILQAKALMFRENRQQWDESYPLPEHITADIARGNAYVLSEEGVIIAYAAVVFDGEPAYLEIKGKWLSSGAYVVVHRLAIAQQMKGLGMAALFLQEVERISLRKGIYSFKVDTNFDNLGMQKILNKLGFSYCGDIFYEKGTRMAYEKLLP